MATAPCIEMLGSRESESVYLPKSGTEAGSCFRLQVPLLVHLPGPVATLERSQPVSYAEGE